MSKLVKLLDKSNRDLIAENRGLQMQIDGLQVEIARLTHMVDELNGAAIDVSDAELTKSYREGIEEGKRYSAAEIARLNHQHANDEAANRMLSEACERQRAGIAILRSHTIKKCAALFSGGVRNRELYVNDVEETILGLLDKER